MKTKTSEELSSMLRSYENAKSIAGILYVLIQIARQEGLLVLEDERYGFPLNGISKESRQVLGMMFEFVCQGSIWNDTELRGTLNTLMNFHGVNSEVERKVLMTGIMAIQKGENPFFIKAGCEKALEKARKSIGYAMKRFLKTEVVENETLMNRWRPPVDPEEEVALSQEDIDEILEGVKELDD